MKTNTIMQFEGQDYVNMDRLFSHKKSLFNALEAAQVDKDRVYKLKENLDEYINVLNEKEREYALKVKESESKINAIKEDLEAKGYSLDDVAQLLFESGVIQAVRSVDHPVVVNESKKQRIPNKVSRKRLPKYKYTDDQGETQYWTGVGRQPVYITHKINSGESSIEDFEMTTEEIEQYYHEMKAKGIEFSTVPGGMNSNDISELVNEDIIRKNSTQIRRKRTDENRMIYLNKNSLKVQALFQLPKYQDNTVNMRSLLSKVPPIYKLIDEDGVVHLSTGRGREKGPAFADYEASGKNIEDLRIPFSERQYELAKKLIQEKEHFTANNILAVEIELLKMSGSDDDLKEVELLSSLYNEEIGLHPLVEAIINNDESAIKRVLEIKDNDMDKIVKEIISDSNDIDPLIEKDNEIKNSAKETVTSEAKIETEASVDDPDDFVVVKDDESFIDEFSPEKAQEFEEDMDSLNF